jgi:hypothetical protein
MLFLRCSIKIQYHIISECQEKKIPSEESEGIKVSYKK